MRPKFGPRGIDKLFLRGDEEISTRLPGHNVPL